ncbi:hypothetical protein [Vibrio sp. MACH09]|nr:hypothetical protein [Vibrio sp. MACH09]
MNTILEGGFTHLINGGQVPSFDRTEPTALACTITMQQLRGDK